MLVRMLPVAISEVSLWQISNGMSRWMLQLLKEGDSALNARSLSHHVCYSH